MGSYSRSPPRAFSTKQRPQVAEAFAFTRSLRASAAPDWTQTRSKPSGPSWRGGFLGKAVAYDNRQTEISGSAHSFPPLASSAAASSSRQPVLLRAKEKYLDWITARHLATGKYDLFHSWSGDCLLSMRAAQQAGNPSVPEIPTWHRDRRKSRDAGKQVQRRQNQSCHGGKRWKKICSWSGIAISRSTTLRL